MSIKYALGETNGEEEAENDDGLSATLNENAWIFRKVNGNYRVFLQQRNRERINGNGINYNPTDHSKIQLQPLPFDI